MITINTFPNVLSNNSALGVKYNLSSNALAKDLVIKCSFSVRGGSGGKWQNKGTMYAKKNALGTFDIDLLNMLSSLSPHQKLIPTSSGLYNLTDVLQFRVGFTELYANSVGIKEEYNPRVVTGYFLNTYTNLNENIAQFTADSLNPNQRYFLTNWIEKPFSLSQTAPILFYFIYEGTDNVKAYIETITSDGNTGDTAPIGEPLVITNKLGCVAIMPQDIPTNTERFRVRLLSKLYAEMAYQFYDDGDWKNCSSNDSLLIEYRKNCLMNEIEQILNVSKGKNALESKPTINPYPTFNQIGDKKKLHRTRPFWR